MQTDIREYLSRKLLDISELFPKFNNRFFQRLRTIRQHQKERASSCFNSTRFPQGIEIKLDKIIMIELFEIEDIKELVSGIKKLLPDVVDKKWLKEFEASAGQMFRLTKTVLGTIVRENEANVFNKCQSSSNLPINVVRINVDLHRFLSSTVAVIFTCDLDSKFSEKLLEIHSQSYLPEVRLSNFNPFRFAGYGMKPAEEALEKAIIGSIAELRISIEEWINQRMNGYFCKNHIAEKLKYPTIELYTSRGIDINKDVFLKNIIDNRRFFQSFGFSSIPQYIYNSENKNVVYFADKIGNHIHVKGTRLLGINDFTSEFLEFDIDAFVLPIILTSYMNNIEDVVNKRRLTILSGISKTAKGLMKKEFRNALMLRRAILVLDRIELELDDSKTWIYDKMCPLNAFIPLKGVNKPEDILFEQMVESIEYQRVRLRKHIQFLEKAQSDFFSFGNIYYTAKLQRTVLWATAIIGIVAIICSMYSNELKLLISEIIIKQLVPK